MRRACVLRAFVSKRNRLARRGKRRTRRSAEWGLPQEAAFVSQKILSISAM